MATRHLPIDRMRGLVMVLMASDHAAHVFYTDHLMRDTALFGGWDDPLPAVPFLHRWLSHLCAPTFVFLAGTSIALSAARRREQARGEFDRDLAVRGLLLIGVDLTMISFMWGSSLGFDIFLQVMYALGAGMIAMVLLRRLGLRAQLGLGLGIVLLTEAAVRMLAPSGPSVPVALALSAGGFQPHLLVTYPAIPWLGAMLLGHAYGVHLARGGDPLRPLGWGAAAALGAFAVVELTDGYGNMLMTGVHDSWLRWLQVSKYPPSIAFLGLELGLMAALLALFTLAERRFGPPGQNGVLVVLGQAALLFYLLHIPLLGGAGVLLSVWLGGEVAGGLGRTWLAVLGAVAVLYPVCRWYRSVKARHPRSVLRFV
jgi:uncharacterized membrane protein